MEERSLFFISYVRAQENLMNLYIREPLDELDLPYWYDRRLDLTPLKIGGTRRQNR